MSVPIYGFSFLRNGLKFDYPFQESLESLASVTDMQILALGQSEDGTESVIETLKTKLSRLQILPTIWDENLKSGGLILSQQTNVALNHLRTQTHHLPNVWGFYLQADELIHENDIEQIRQDFANAEQSGCDVVSFRYLHFWQTYRQIAVNKKWYPEEIRGVKLKSSVESWGDAQSFRNYQKVYHSDVCIYHYGHVKNPTAYTQKQQYFVTLHHAGDKKAQQKSLAKEIRPQTAIPYWGPHPRWLKSRMSYEFESLPQPQNEPLYIVDAQLLSQALKAQFTHPNVIWVTDLKKIRGVSPKNVVVLNTKSWWQKLWAHLQFPSRTPKSMASPQARPWPYPLWLLLKLSEKGYGLK